MNIYLIERTDIVGYDEYDSLVCTAETEQDAREMWYDLQWTNEGDTDMLIVTVIGKVEAYDQTPAEVICASFNAS